MDQPLSPGRTFGFPPRSWRWWVGGTLPGCTAPARMHRPPHHVDKREAAHAGEGARDTVASRRNRPRIYSPPSGSAVPAPSSSLRASSEPPLWPESTELVLLLATKRALA